MNKTTAIAEIVAATTDEPIIFTTGYSCRVAQGLADRPNHFYMTGSMGLAACIGTGVALTSGRRVVVVDGDGALAMNPACLLTAGAIPDLPLLHVVLDDGRYESTGGQDVPAERTNFSALATAAGYRSAWRVDSVAAFVELLRRELATCTAPTLIHCELTGLERTDPGARVEADLYQHRLRFSQNLALAAG